MVSPSFHLPTHIPVTILMLLFLLSPGSKRSGNPAGFTSNEHPDFGRSLPLRAAAVALATIVAPWDCCGCFPGPLLLPSPRKVGLHTPSLGQATFLLCLKPSQGSPLPCCQCQDLVMAWEALQCRGPAPADPGYSKRGRRRRLIYIYLFIKDSKSNRMRIAQ